MKNAVKCVNLKEIMFYGGSNYDFRKILKTLKSFKKLEKISFINVQMKFFPIELLNLEQIQIINLSENYIAYIPCEIEHMSNLKELNISYNPNFKLSTCLSKLTEKIKIIYPKM